MQSNLDKLFKTDSKLDKEGVFFEVSEGVRFKIRRYDPANPEIKNIAAKHYKPFAKLIQVGGMSDEKQQELMIAIFAEACITDWEGVQIDGEEVPFTTEAAIKLLRSLPILADTLLSHASDFKNYREELGNF